MKKPKTTLSTVLAETVGLAVAASWLAACLLLLNAYVRYYDATPKF
jgi:hypothetical protein